MTRRRLSWARIVRLLAVVVVAGLLVEAGYLWWDRVLTHTGGPVIASTGHTGGPLEVGKDFSYPSASIFNSSTSPAHLEKLRFVGVTGGLEVLSVEAVPDGPMTFPFVIPGASHDGSKLVDARVEIQIGLRAPRPGVTAIRGLEATYRIGHRRYRSFGEGPMYNCAYPPGQPPPEDCPGSAEGKFDDGVVEFPARGN